MSFEVDTGAFSVSQQALGPASSPTFTGLTLSGLTQGSVPFIGAGGVLSQDNLALNWSDSGKLFVVNAGGTALPSAIAGAVLQLGQAPGIVPRLQIDAFAATAAFNPRRANGTISAPSALLLNDQIFGFGARGYGTTGYSSSVANINIYAAENWSDTAQGSLIQFLTTPIGAVSAATALAITPSGGLVTGLFSVPTIVGIDPGKAGLYLGGTATKTRSYNSFTDASNGEWAYMGDWSTSNVATYGTDKNGTGSARNIQFVVGGANKLDYGITVAASWVSPSRIRGGVLSTTGYTVATLPAGVVGDSAYVTDALAPTFLATIVGGGAITTPVFYNGSAWVGG